MNLLLKNMIFRTILLTCSQTQFHEHYSRLYKWLIWLMLIATFNRVRCCSLASRRIRKLHLNTERFGPWTFISCSTYSCFQNSWRKSMDWNVLYSNEVFLCYEKLMDNNEYKWIVRKYDKILHQDFKREDNLTFPFIAFSTCVVLRFSPLL